MTRYHTSMPEMRTDGPDFSIPWMNLGISIIFVKPKKAPPSLLSFLQPFTIEVWLYVGFGKFDFEKKNNVVEFQATLNTDKKDEQFSKTSIFEQ